MTTTTTTHRTWCTDHDTELGECVSAARDVGRAAVWAVDIEGQPTIVLDAAAPGGGLTPTQAREMAAELVRLADTVEEA